MCGRIRPNEYFGGKGRRRHLCKKCRQRPRAEQDRVKALLAIEGYFEQRNISEKNVAHLKELCSFPDADIRETAEVLLEVARIKPHKRKRLGYLARRAPDLLTRLEQCGLILARGEAIDDPEAAYESEREWERQLEFDFPEPAVDVEVFFPPPENRDIPF
jgi:hypothetical protein